MLSYIGGDLLEQRFARTQSAPYAGHPSGTDFEVESWLEHQAQKFVRQFDPWSYWYVSRAMDLFDVAGHAAVGGPRHQQSQAEAQRLRALEGLRVGRALVIGVREDILFPISQQRAVAAALRTSGIDTEFVELSSPYGHDAFLVERDTFTPVLADFLRDNTGSAHSPEPDPTRKTLSR